MNELWIVGVIGGGAGAAVGGPLLLRGRMRGEPWTTEQLIGSWLLGAAVAMLLVGVRHGSLLSPGWDQVVEHLTSAMSLVAWTTLVSLTRRMAQLTPGWPNSLGAHLALPAIYVATIVVLGNPDVRFLWLMPVGVVSVLGIGRAWLTARLTARPEAARQAGTVFIFSLVFCAAQWIRSLFPRVAELREIVPVVMTIGFFVIAFGLARRRAGTAVSPRSVPRTDPDDRITGNGPLYRKSRLTPSEADRLIEVLDARIQAKGWYREPDLSLATLAGRMGVAPQTLSQALNQRRRQSLTEYLAERRMREAKLLLLDPANDCYTVEGLARQSGFASRSVFYRMFRQAEGVTPTQYRERARQVGSAAETEPPVVAVVT
jgi:AraC-like DNA-binding protein